MAKTSKPSRSFLHFLIYMVLEWTMVSILFVDGFLAFIASEFAKFFNLKPPCLLCTRIDHAIVDKESDFYYNDSICEFHKKGVSSMAYCYNHKKLSDIRKMCEGCLLSFATERESDCDTYKFLLGILHKDLECYVGDDDREIQLSLTDDGGGSQMERSSTQKCCCCGEPLKVKSSNSKGKKNSAMFSQTLASAPVPSPSEIDSEIQEVEDDISSVISQDSKLREDAKAAASQLLLTEGDDLNEENSSTKSNKLVGIRPLTDIAISSSPRLSYRINNNRRSSALEDSNEGSIVSNEVSEDAMLPHLNKQVRLDRKSLMALCMELDEERNASAVAANNAMAMITRLQAEKAAVQMEALQYQRMMEEQAEYDDEALQTTNEMLVKREEEMKELEALLELYREKYGTSVEDEFQEYHDWISEDEHEEEKGLNDHQAVSLMDFKGEKNAAC